MKYQSIFYGKKKTKKKIKISYSENLTQQADINLKIRSRKCSRRHVESIQMFIFPEYYEKCLAFVFFLENSLECRLSLLRKD